MVSSSNWAFSANLSVRLGSINHAKRIMKDRPTEPTQGERHGSRYLQHDGRDVDRILHKVLWEKNGRKQHSLCQRWEEDEEKKRKFYLSLCSFKTTDFSVVSRTKNTWTALLNVWQETLTFINLIQCCKAILDNVFLCFPEGAYQSRHVCRNGWSVYVSDL